MSDEERDANIPETKERHEVKTKVEREEKTVETTEHKGLSQLEMILLVLLALVVGFILAFILPKLIEKFRQPNVQYIPHYVPFMPPPPMRPPRRHRRKAGADIDPRAFLRTPPELRRHGIYLDEAGEACMAGPTMYETWSIVRDESGNIIDAHRVESEEE